MKKVLAYLLLILSIITIFAPLNAMATEKDSNINVVGVSVSPGNEIGGFLPNYAKGIMGSGLIFEFEKPPCIVAITRSDANVTTTLDTSGVNLAPGEKIGDLFFAVYNAEGRLTFVSETKDALAGINSYAWSNNNFAGGTKVKVYMWESTTFRPLCLSKTVIL